MRDSLEATTRGHLSCFQKTPLHFFFCNLTLSSNALRSLHVFMRHPSAWWMWSGDGIWYAEPSLKKKLALPVGFTITSYRCSRRQQSNCQLCDSYSSRVAARYLKWIWTKPPFSCYSFPRWDLQCYQSFPWWSFDSSRRWTKARQQQLMQKWGGNNNNVNATIVFTG